MSWTIVPSALAYRVYRSRTANLGAGHEELLATVAAPQTDYLDLGGVTDASEVPLRLGDLGVWKGMPALAKAREGLGLAKALDPGTGATWSLYALAGRQNATTALGTYEEARCPTFRTGESPPHPTACAIHQGQA